MEVELVFLQQDDRLWREFKEAIERFRVRELEKAAAMPPGPERDEQLAVAKAMRRFLDAVTTKEREAYARAKRVEREQRAGAGPVRTTVIGFDKHLRPR